MKSGARELTRTHWHRGMFTVGLGRGRLVRHLY